MPWSCIKFLLVKMESFYPLKHRVASSCIISIVVIGFSCQNKSISLKQKENIKILEGLYLHKQTCIWSINVSKNSSLLFFLQLWQFNNVWETMLKAYTECNCAENKHT